MFLFTLFIAQWRECARPKKPHNLFRLLKKHKLKHKKPKSMRKNSRSVSLAQTANKSTKKDSSKKGNIMTY
jgi:hypothetical protein